MSDGILCDNQYSKMDLWRGTLLNSCGETDISGKHAVLDGFTVSKVSRGDNLYEPNEVLREGANGQLGSVSSADASVKWIDYSLEINGDSPLLEVLLMNSKPVMRAGKLVGYNRVPNAPTNPLAIEHVFVDDQAVCDEDGASDIWQLIAFVKRWTRDQTIDVDGKTVVKTVYKGRGFASSNFDDPYGAWPSSDPGSAGGADTPIWYDGSDFAEDLKPFSDRPTASCEFQTVGESS